MAHVDAHVDNTRLVIRMITGLTKQHDPLPLFETAKSKLALEETTIKQRQARENGNTVVVSHNQNIQNENSTSNPPNSSKNSTQYNHNSHLTYVGGHRHSGGGGRNSGNRKKDVRWGRRGGRQGDHGGQQHHG